MQLFQVILGLGTPPPPPPQAVLGVEPRALHILDKCFTTWALLPAYPVLWGWLSCLCSKRWESAALSPWMVFTFKVEFVPTLRALCKRNGKSDTDWHGHLAGHSRSELIHFFKGMMEFKWEDVCPGPFYCATVLWTLGQHLEPLYQSFIVMGFFRIGSSKPFAWADFELWLLIFAFW
jgi:hypothetical protein